MAYSGYRWKYQVTCGSNTEVFLIETVQDLFKAMERMTMRFGPIDLVYNLGFTR